MKCKNNCYKIYYQYKIAGQNFTPDDYFLYILSLYSCHLHHIARVRKYISHTLKGFIDCLLLTNQIDITEHRNYINKINLYVKYTKKKGVRYND